MAFLPTTRYRFTLYFLCLLVLHPTSFAETHGSTVDTGVPIASLDNLTSVKNAPTKPLGYSPTIASFTTKTGTPVLFVQASQLPIVDVRITFNAGSARDEAIKPKGYGLAALTADMLTKGTTNQTEEDINQAIEQYGLSLSSQSYKDMFVVSYRSLNNTRYLKKASEITADMLANAAFPTDALERTRAQSMVSIKQANEKPNVIANNAFFKALYGEHPYAHPTSGTLQSLPTLTRADLLTFKNTFLVAKNASIAITGDLTTAQAKGVAELLTHSLPVGKKAPALPTPKTAKAEHIHVSFPSNQTTFVMGQLGITRHSPIRYDLAIANDILGGGEFHALLMRELREKRGLTYGAYSSFSPMQTTGPFTIGFSTRNDKADEALTVAQATLKEYLNKGATQKQIDDTKTSQINQFPLNIASNASINGWLGAMAFYNMPTDYIGTYTTNLKKVTKDSANAAFISIVSSDKLITVTVGPKKPDAKTFSAP